MVLILTLASIGIAICYRKPLGRSLINAWNNQRNPFNKQQQPDDVVRSPNTNHVDRSITIVIDDCPKPSQNEPPVYVSGSKIPPSYQICMNMYSSVTLTTRCKTLDDVLHIVNNENKFSFYREGSNSKKGMKLGVIQFKDAGNEFYIGVAGEITANDMHKINALTKLRIPLDSEVLLQTYTMDEGWKKSGEPLRLVAKA